MTWQAAAAFLACARIGAVHSAVFAGFSAESLRDRVNDCDCRVLITTDEGKRGGKSIATKASKSTSHRTRNYANEAVVDNALESCPLVEHVLVLKRTGGKVNMKEGRDSWWHEECDKVQSFCPCEPMNSEDPLFILYVSFILDKADFRLPDLLGNPRVSSTLPVATSSKPSYPSNTYSTSTQETSSPVWQT